LSEPVEVYEATGTGAARSRLQAAAARGLTRFVGRDAEVDQLQKALEQARAGRGQLVAVIGEPGVGKSRLFYEFVHSQRTEGWLILQAGSVSHGKATSYLPVIDLFKGYFKVHDRETHREIREKVIGKLFTADRALEPAIPALLALLDVPVEDAQWAALDPRLRRRQTHDAVKRLLLRESQEQPLLLIFEDLHWVDGETKVLLDSLIDSLPTSRVLLLVSYRPEFQHAWGGKSYYTQLRLDTLSPEGADELLLALLGTDTSVELLKPVLIAKTGGNPLFLEESVRMLVDTNALVGERGAYRLAKPLDAIDVPLTVQAILASRIDRLDTQDKQVLQMASVVGKHIPFALLLSIAELPEEDLRRALARLQSAEFLYEAAVFPDLEYTFKHALTHEVAYVGLLHDRRRLMHSRATEAIERLSAERVSEQAELLAYHAVRGELWDKAVAYLRQAGLRAMARAAHREAVAHLEQAHGALRHFPETRATIELTIDVRLDLRNALLPLGETSRIGEHLHEAEMLARTLGDQHRLAWIATFMVVQCRAIGDYEDAVRFGREALGIARTLGDRALEVVATSNLGHTYAARGEFSNAATLLERNVALEGELLHERFGGVAIQSAYSGAWLADVLSELGRFDEAIGHADAAVQICEAADHVWTLYWALFGLGLSYLRRGDCSRAARILGRCLELCQTWNIVVGTSTAAAALSAAYALAGRVDDALPLIAGAVEEFRRRQRYERPAFTLLFAGVTYLSAGRIDEAASHAREALALTRRLGARGGEAHALGVTGDVASAGGGADAESYYREALALASELSMRPLVAHCHLGLGKLYRRTDKREQAREHLATATTMYREMGMTYWLKQAEAELK
jgi:tetratricopeptide (TPR) repeat protein